MESVPGKLKELGNARDFLNLTGFGSEPGNMLCLAKLWWFQTHQAALWSQVRYLMTISDYLVFCLTGLRFDDSGTASLTAAWDTAGNRWWPKAWEIINTDESYLSKPLLPGTMIGETSPAAAESLGLKSGTPVVAGSLDHYVAALGAGVGTVADMSESTGTVLAGVNFSDRFKPAPGICTGPGFAPDKFCELTWSENGAQGLEWYQEKFAPEYTVDQLVEQAAAVSPHHHGLKAKPMVWQYADLDGFSGVSEQHNHGHFIRAIMESTADTLNELCQKLNAGRLPRTIVATGGGAKSSLWLKIKSQTLGTKFIRTDCSEPACRGAAMLAAVAARWFPSWQSCAEDWIKPVSPSGCG